MKTMPFFHHSIFLQRFEIINSSIIDPMQRENFQVYLHEISKIQHLFVEYFDFPNEQGKA